MDYGVGMALPSWSVTAVNTFLRFMKSIPFSVNVSDPALSDLKLRLGLTRWPDEIGGSEWEYGMPLAVVKKIVKHWRDGFDWREAERKLNRLQQFQIEAPVSVRSLPMSQHGYPAAVAGLRGKAVEHSRGGQLDGRTFFCQTRLYPLARTA